MNRSKLGKKLSDRVVQRARRQIDNQPDPRNYLSPEVQDLGGRAFGEAPPYRPREATNKPEHGSDIYDTIVWAKSPKGTKNYDNGDIWTWLTLASAILVPAYLAGQYLKANDLYGRQPDLQRARDYEQKMLQEYAQRNGH